MSARPSAAEFHREPLRVLERELPAGGAALWLPGRQLFVAEPAAARAILTNRAGLYHEHSDFFQTRHGMFGPRSAQVEIGRASRRLLETYLAAGAGGWPEAIRGLGPASEWPDAGNRLVYRRLRGALIAEDGDGPDERLGRTIDEVVERAVLAGARERSSRWRRWRLRRRVALELGEAVAERRRRGAEPPRDLLDVVVAGGGPEARADQLGEVFLSFVFAIAGSLGFVLGWSIYLLGTHPREDVEPAWVVREALRLWPVAWVLARRPARPHEVAGFAVGDGDEVVACPWLVHRHPGSWAEPAAFRPERWAEPGDRGAFMPFGLGPHRCVAASLTLRLIEELLRILVTDHRIEVTVPDHRPFVGPALAPPRFTLGLTPRPRPADERR